MNQNINIYLTKEIDLNFGEFDHAFDIIDKVRDGKIDLSDIKNNQENFKSYVGEIKKGRKSKAQKKPCIKWKCSIKQETKLLHFMMIIL